MKNTNIFYKIIEFFLILLPLPNSCVDPWIPDSYEPHYYSIALVRPEVEQPGMHRSAKKFLLLNTIEVSYHFKKILGQEKSKNQF